MKELSIEEKVKAYDNIIEKANKMHSENCEACQMCIEELIPELAEPEDERIRKGIIRCVKGNMPDNDYRKKYLDWLEKQGEQKPVWSEKDEHWRQKAIDFMKHPDLIKATPTLAKDTIDWLKSLKDRVQPKQEWKQENTDDLTDFENAMMHIGGSFFGENAGLDPNDTNAIKEQANLLLELAPKLSWSEEDSIKLQRIIDFLWYNRKGDTDTIYQQEQDIDWLKSLRDRVQPKQEWSDKDIEILESCISLMSYNDAAKEETDWLKHLRLQLKQL